MGRQGHLEDRVWDSDLNPGSILIGLILEINVNSQSPFSPIKKREEAIERRNTKDTHGCTVTLFENLLFVMNISAYMKLHPRDKEKEAEVLLPFISEDNISASIHPYF